MSGFFIRHRITGFETYLPEDQWDPSMEAEYERRDPEEELRLALAKMQSDSDRHDEAIKPRPGKPKAEQPTDPKKD